MFCTIWMMRDCYGELRWLLGFLNIHSIESQKLLSCSFGPIVGFKGHQGLYPIYVYSDPSYNACIILLNILSCIWKQYGIECLLLRCFSNSYLQHRSKHIWKHFQPKIDLDLWVLRTKNVLFRNWIPNEALFITGLINKSSIELRSLFQSRFEDKRGYLLLLNNMMPMHKATSCPNLNSGHCTLAKSGW